MRAQMAEMGESVEAMRRNMLRMAQATQQQQQQQQQQPAALSPPLLAAEGREPGPEPTRADGGAAGPTCESCGVVQTVWSKFCTSCGAAGPAEPALECDGECATKEMACGQIRQGS